MELFASDLHINQILVDNSVGAMDLEMGGSRARADLAGERGKKKYVLLTSASSPGFLSRVPSLPTSVLPSLLSCQLVH